MTKIILKLVIVFAFSGLAQAGNIARRTIDTGEYGKVKVDISFCDRYAGDMLLATYVKAIKELETENQLSKYGIEDHLFFKSDPKKEVLTHFSDCLERSNSSVQTVEEAKKKLLEMDGKLLKRMAMLQRQVIESDRAVIRPLVENRNLKMIQAIDKANDEKTYRTVLQTDTNEKGELFVQLCVNAISFLGQYSKTDRKCSHPIIDAKEAQDAKELNALSNYVPLNYREMPDVSPADLIAEVKRSRLAYLCSENQLQLSRKEALAAGNERVLKVLDNITICPENKSGTRKSKAIN
ncbi:MAG: hypothetical protein VX642_03465 [Bdellovibrionota bacterium]|nr:hypothetical protein [Bdellovibrionota bacterium]